MNTAFFWIHTRGVIAGMLFFGSMAAHGEDYNPLAVPLKIKINIIDTEGCDLARAREIPIRVYLAAGPSPSPVILYSHGLGGSREGSSYLGKHWAARGYMAVFLQHPGSDTSVWKDVPLLKRLRAMKKAANAQNFLLRVQDVSAVLDQLEIWNTTEGHKLQGRLEMAKIGMSGHSFGARTTQAVSGEQFERQTTVLADERILAALPMSPSSPSGGTSSNTFGGVSIPWMLMTGTKDTAPFGNNHKATSRLAVYPALPPGGKYELVLFDAEHSAFSDQPLRRRAKPRNPSHHRTILALSTAFFDAYLREDKAAQEWLDGKGPRSILQRQDTWQKK